MKILSATMAAFGRMNVGRQFAAGFAVVLLLMAVLGAVALLSLGQADERARELEGKWLAGVGHLAEARAAIIEMRDLEIKHSRTDDRSYHSEYEEKFAEARRRLSPPLAAYKALWWAKTKPSCWPPSTRAGASTRSSASRCWPWAATRSRPTLPTLPMALHP